MTTGWIIGYAVGAGVVVVVAVLVVAATLEARRVVGQAADIIAALEEARDNTMGLWDVANANRHLESIVDAAVHLRRLAAGDRP